MYKKYKQIASIIFLALIVGVSSTVITAQDVRTLVPSVDSRVCDDFSIWNMMPENTFDVTGDRVSEIIDDFSKGKKRVEQTRIFSSGYEIDNHALVLGFEPEKARFNPTTRTILVIGNLNGSEVIQDIRIVDLGDDIVGIVADFYLDGLKADTTIGRGTPFSLPSDFESKSETEVSAAAVTGPVISSWTGANVPASGVSNGRVSMSCGATWNGGFAINDMGGKFPITINGSGFGSTRGTILIAGRSATITSWSNTRIVIDPTLPWTSDPFCAVVKLTTSSGAVANSAMDVVPAISTRIYGQCTHFVAKTRKQNGLNPSQTAYGGYSSINTNYVPRKNDQYKWGDDAHTGIVTNVTGPVSTTGGYKTWKITIGEQNPDCRNGIKSSVTEFQTRTVNGSTSVTKNPKSWASGYNGATWYYR